MISTIESGTFDLLDFVLGELTTDNLEMVRPLLVVSVTEYSVARTPAAKRALAAKVVMITSAKRCSSNEVYIT